MHCPNCGHDNPAGVRFCVACGSAMPASGPGGQAGPVRVQQPSTFSTTNIFFMEYVLSLLSDGAVFRNLFAIALRVLAIVGAIIGALVWLWLWATIGERVKEMSELGAGTAGGIIGSIVFQLLFLVFLYMVVHTMLIRARNIAELGHSEITLIPIASIFVKLLGELVAIVDVFLGVALGVLLWIAGPSGPELVLPGVAGAGATQNTFGSFFGGLLLIVVWPGAAFITLVFYYLLSELIGVIGLIARNTEAIRRVFERSAPSEPPTA